MVWSELSSAQQDNIRERVRAGEAVQSLAIEFKLNPESLGRKLRLLRGGSNELYYQRSYVAVQTQRMARVLVYSDCHFGMHDPRALVVAIKIAEEFKPDIIINNGDTLDCHNLSRFKHDPRAASIQDERDFWFLFAEALNSVAPKADKFITVGNHDLRYKNEIGENSGLAEMSEFSLDALLYTKQLGYAPLCDVVMFNPHGNEDYPDASLYVFHGESARSQAGATARFYSDMFAGGSTITGHAHRSATYTRRVGGGVIQSYEVGALCRISPEYTLYPNWTQSILTGYVDSDTLTFSNNVIRDGRTIFNGRKIVATEDEVKRF